MTRMNHEETFEPGESCEDLERRLRRQRFRQPPAAWREAILAAARAGGAQGDAAMSGRDRDVAPDPNHPRRGGPPQVPSWWERMVSGWTLVGAAWLLVLCLRGGFVPERRPEQDPLPPLSAAAQAELMAQQRMLSETST